MNQTAKLLFGSLILLPLAGCPSKGGTKAVDDTKPDDPTETAATDCSAYPAPESGAWMTWEDGVDVAGMTEEGLAMPNVLVHVAGMVHTPEGSAPSGMILYQPDPNANPEVMGYVSTDPNLSAWYGPNIFAGTPFEQAPALTGRIDVERDGDTVTSRTEVGGHVFEVEMTGVGEASEIDRAAGSPMPFSQQGTEAEPASVVVKVDGEPVEMTVLPQGVGGGPGAVYAPCGVYAR